LSHASGTCAHCVGMTARFGMEWVRFFKRNHCALSSGTSARFRAEFAPGSGLDHSPNTPTLSGPKLGGPPHNVEPPGAGEKAAGNAEKNIGVGPEDCGKWLRKDYLGIKGMPDDVADTWPGWFKDHPKDWEPIPNDGKHALKPGDVITTDSNGKDNGHIEIIGTKGDIIGASIGKHHHPGKRRGYVQPGTPISDAWPDRGGTVTIWRPKDRPGK
ncbi:MAG TPA: hypothetical protein VKU00_14190, partial [Chthonomonadaceae bacterium]|nr:hypothetical protein [Chthonomonadaceae bacterium]